MNTSDDQQVLQAQQFRVIDREGNVRAVLGMEGDAATSPSLRLLRMDGTIAVTIGFANDRNPYSSEEALPERPFIKVHDDKEVVRILLEVIEDEYVRPQFPSIQLNDREGKVQAYLTVTPDDEGQVGVMSRLGGDSYVITPGD